MERYRLLGIEHGGRESASARVVSREPNKWGVFPLHTFNSGDEVVLAADAQATVEALQVRAEQAERLVASQAQEIMQRRQTLGDLAHLHQEQSKQLTQRTAELEAAKAGQAIDLKNNNAYREQVATLQAELERVRGLVKALPKVEAVPMTEAGAVNDPERCPRTKHVDGKSHGWLFWGDDPYIKCDWCGEIRDALTGQVAGLT